MEISEVVYPYVDDLGDTWVDPSGLVFLTQRKCFICKRWTNRLDMDFDDFFCNSYACNLTIELDLKEMTVAEAQTQQELVARLLHG